MQFSVKNVLERIKDVDPLRRPNKQISCTFSRGNKLAMFEFKLRQYSVWPGAHYLEPATPIINQCNGIFTDQSIFRYYSREIGQFQSTWARFGKNKTMRSHVNTSTWCRHANNSPCLWLQLVTEVPVGIWIRDKFRLKIDRSVKTPWQEHGVVAGS